MITEADEGATSKAQALANVAYQTAMDETMGVVAMYERAAMAAGATMAETERAAKIGRLVREFHLDVKARRAVGDGRPEYHAQAPKVRAYRLLMDGGMKPREAVEAVRTLLAAIERNGG